MLGTLSGLVVLILATALFGWLTRKARDAVRGWLKWVGLVLAGLLTLIFAFLTLVGALGTYRLFRAFSVSVPAVTVAGTPEQVARGEHLADVLCSGCHSLGGGLPLSGGRNLSEDAGIPLGDIYAPNITPAGDIRDMSNAGLFRLLRTGVSEQGRATAMTSIAGPRTLSDEDTLAVIAYLRQAPPIEYETPPFNPSILMALLTGAGLVPMEVPPAVTPVTAAPKAPSLEYGQYVMGYMDCASCHGPKLDGAVAPPFPAGPNLQADLYAWSLEQFVDEINTHAASAKPDEVMPWKDISRLDAIELEALYLWLHQIASQ